MVHVHFWGGVCKDVCSNKLARTNQRSPSDTKHLSLFCAGAKRRLELAERPLPLPPADAAAANAAAARAVDMASVAITRKETVTNLPESIEELRQVLHAQAALLEGHSTSASDEWYSEGTHTPLKGKNAHHSNQPKTTLGILLLETKVDHLLPGM